MIFTLSHELSPPEPLRPVSFSHMHEVELKLQPHGLALSSTDARAQASAS